MYVGRELMIGGWKWVVTVLRMIDLVARIQIEHR